MAVTFPRDLPAGISYTDVQFTLRRSVNRNELDSGATQVVEYAPARWRVTIATQPFRLALKHGLEVWWDSLQDGMNTFRAYDPFRPKPYAYRATSIPVTTGAVLSSVGGDHIGWTGFPNPITLTEGDWIGLTQSGKRGLYRSRETKTSSSGALTVEVEPVPLTTVFTTSATFDFNQPKGEFLPEMGSFDISRDGGLFRAQWSGIQKLY